jgi:hypothetical protein
MENPNRHIVQSALLVVFGMILGGIPGAIKLDQLRRQVDAELAESTKLNEELRAAVADEKQKRAAEHADCQNAILGDGGRTILVDTNHPYGAIHQTFYGALLEMPGAAEVTARNQLGIVQVGPGPIWVIPRAITPHVVDGILGAAYTHVWPNGRTDGWHMPSRAE